MRNTVKVTYRKRYSQMNPVEVRICRNRDESESLINYPPMQALELPAEVEQLIADRVMAEWVPMMQQFEIADTATKHALNWKLDLTLARIAADAEALLGR